MVSKKSAKFKPGTLARTDKCLFQFMHKTYAVRGDRQLRFSIVLITGVTIVNFFIFSQLVFPIFWPLPWYALGGFVVGFVVGALTQDLRTGILNGLLSVFLSSMESSIILYHVWGYYAPLHFMWLLWAVGPACVPTVIGGAFVGSLVRKEIIQVTPLGPYLRREYEVWKYLALISSALSVLLLLGGVFAHEFSETAYFHRGMPIAKHPYRDYTYSLIPLGLVLLVIGVLSFGRTEELKKLEVVHTTEK